VIPEKRKSASKTMYLSTGISNLSRANGSGTYFARAKVGGRLIRQSLETKNKRVARLRLAKLLRDIQTATPTHPANNGSVSLGALLAEFESEASSAPDLKPATRYYYQRCVNAIRKTFPDATSCDVSRITEEDCRRWRDNLLRQGLLVCPPGAKTASRHIGANYFNQIVGVYKKVLQKAVELGVRFDNPASGLKRCRIPKTELRLPSKEQFTQMVRLIRSAGGRWNRDGACADAVEFYAYTGCRLNEGVNVLWQDVDLGCGAMTIRGDPITGTKGGGSRTIPLIPNAKELLCRLKGRFLLHKASDRVLEIASFQGSLDRACRLVGCPRLTHHGLRHLFATACIEAGVDIPTVSRWLGHKDGGVLAMSTYGHVRTDHGQEQCKKVTF